MGKYKLSMEGFWGMTVRLLVELSGERIEEGRREEKGKGKRNGQRNRNRDNTR